MTQDCLEQQPRKAAAVADVIVIGLGAMGSAAAAWLAMNGHHVLGFDRYAPPHAHGSSHGRSRIYRQSYWEDPRYVPLLLRARELWEKMERDSGRQLMHWTGGLMISHRDGQLVPRSAESARQFGLPHELLSAKEIQKRWPVFRVDPDAVALFERDAGYLVPEVCIEQMLRQAASADAQLHLDEPVLEWSARGPGSVTVKTARGSYAAERLIITTGPWAPHLLAEMNLPLRITRQVVFWFEPKETIDRFRESCLPIYLFEAESGKPVLYGFPLTGPESEGVKVAAHGSEELCTPETVRRAVRPEDQQAIRDRLETTLPSLAGRLVRAEICLYTMTPDEHFVIGPDPGHPEVIVAAGFSGHGFKFAPVIGEILGDLAVTGKSRHDIALFSPRRFTPFRSTDENPTALEAQ